MESVNKKRWKHRDNDLYMIYRAMSSRCKHPSNKSYKIYGGRGIKCKWKSYGDFKKDMYRSYLVHLKKNGKMNTTIDRINNNSNYCKENCRWATKKEQSKNMRTNIIYNGECASEASRRLGGVIHLVTSRIKDGWTLERAFTTPVMQQYSHKH